MKGYFLIYKSNICVPWLRHSIVYATAILHIFIYKKNMQLEGFRQKSLLPFKVTIFTYVMYVHNNLKYFASYMFLSLFSSDMVELW